MQIGVAVFLVADRVTKGLAERAHSGKAGPDGYCQPFTLCIRGWR
jgi:hypothetical protein